MPKIKVARAFLVKGERQEVGAVIEVTTEFARELIATGKAEPAQEIAPAKGPMTLESTPALVAGAKKGK